MEKVVGKVKVTLGISGDSCEIVIYKNDSFVRSSGCNRVDLVNKIEDLLRFFDRITGKRSHYSKALRLLKADLI